MYAGRELWAALEAAAELVNTGPPVWRDERLTTPAELQAFCDRRHIPAPAPVTDADVTAARTLRDQLRPVFLTDDESTAVAQLNALVADAHLRPQLEHDGHAWRWHPQPPPEAPLSAYLAARTAVALLSLIARDGLARLHGCAADGCHGVFVDTTRNRSRRFCIPELCGNRTNLAAYRARRRTHQTRP